jgi:hypothetical protein
MALDHPFISWGPPMLILPTTANVSNAEAAGEQLKYRTVHLSMTL